jgi:xanthine/uracil permease
MTKMETIKFGGFMDGSYKKELSKKDLKVIRKIMAATGPALVMIVPKAAFAATADATFGNVHGAIMNVFDAGVVLVIIFAGASWGLGHRTKAIEILIGVCCGYILARHAVDIRDFLKGI